MNTMNTKKIVVVMALMIAVLLSQNVWATKALVTEAEVAPPTPSVTPIDLEPEAKKDWHGLKY